MAPNGPVTHILTKLERVKAEGKRQWSARCPAHDDKDPSLSIGEGHDGRVLLTCHAGCDLPSILGALGMRDADLFAEASTNGTGDRKEIVAEYDYVDEDGALLFQAVRFFPKDFRQRRPDGAGGWTWSLKDTRRVLYRLPAVLEAGALGKLIHVVEGEKDVHAIEAAGGIATTNPMGAGKWSPEYTEALRGARVRIVADRDDAGRAHAENVAAELEGVAESVETVQAREGKDASDHLEAGHGLDDFEPVTAEDGENVVFATLAELEARPELLQPPPCVIPRLAYRGRLTLLAGPDKAGKSTLLAHAVSHLSHGRRFLGEPVGARHKSAVWLGLEEAVGDAVRRFHDLGAEGERVRLVVSPSRGLLDHTHAALEEQPADLVVIDSLAEYARVTCGVAPEDGDTSAWGTVVRPLVALARRYEAAIVLLHHVRRSDGEYRGAGEIAAAADLLLEMKRPEPGEDPAMRRITGRGRWDVEGFAVALRDDRYELAGGTPLSRDALVLIHVEQNPGCSLNSVSGSVTGRKQVIADTVRELVARGAIENRGGEGEWALYPIVSQTELGTV